MESKINWKEIKNIKDQEQYQKKIIELIDCGALSKKKENNYELFSKDGNGFNPPGIYFTSEECAKSYMENLGSQLQLIHHPPLFTSRLFFDKRYGEKES